VKFDKYWVASTFVQVPANRASAGWWALAVIAIGSTLLLVIAAPARAEALPEAAVTAASTSTSTATEVAGQTAAEAVPVEPVEAAPAEAVETAPNPEPVAPEETAAVVESTVATATAKPPVVTTKVTVDEVTSDHVASAATRTSPLTPSASEEIARATGASELVAETRRTSEALHEAPGAVGPRLTDAPATKPLFRLVETVTAAGQEQIRAIVELANDPAHIGGLPLQGEVPQAPVPTSSRPSTTSLSLPGELGQLAGDPLSGGGGEADAIDLLPRQLAGFAGAELSRLPSDDRSARTLLSAGHPAAGWSAAQIGGAIEGSDNRAPLESPAPPLGSSETAAGSSGSSFLPLVALLALLALAAPTVGRRRWQVPDFRASCPFVCALERPG
jgi:MYXO-CTERM domain-containing protein